MAIVLTDVSGTLEEEEQICLSFIQGESQIGGSRGGFLSFRNGLARLILRRTFSSRLNGYRVVLYEGEYGEHHFINPFHQFINAQRERFRKDQSNNVRLRGNLYDQVRIAYAVPRKIALITVCDGNKMNMFPTDLHGPCGNVFYIISLRKGGKANLQVEQTRKLILSFMPVNEFRAVYALGKNHMQDMKDFDEFSILSEPTTILKLPIPSAALHYKELELIDSLDAGIHRIHFYKNVHDGKITQGNTLAHIHQYYAQWRIDHKFPVNMRLR